MVLKPADTQKLFRRAVYYKAQSAPTQLRNSGGVKFADGYYLLATLVDTSGYSSDVHRKVPGLFHHRVLRSNLVARVFPQASTASVSFRR